MKEKIRYTCGAVEQAPTYEAAIYKATSDLLTSGVVSAAELDSLAKEIKEEKSHRAIDKDAVVFYGNPREKLNQPFLAYLYLRGGMTYNQQTVHHVFTFCARDNAQHSHILDMIIRFTRSEKDNLSCQSMVDWFKDVL